MTQKYHGETVYDDSDEAFDTEKAAFDTPDPLDQFAPGIDLERLYLNNIGRIPLLTAEQEVDLAKRIEAGLIATEILKLAGISIDDQKSQKNPEDAVLKLDIDEEPAADEAAAEPGAEDNRLDLEAHAERCLTDWQYRRDLGIVARDGTQAMEHLQEANTKLVVSLAKRHQGRGLPLLDLIQHGNIGLHHAAEMFDYTKGYKFSTYATWWIRQAVIRGIANDARVVRLPLNVDAKARQLDRATKDLTVELGREPEIADLADRLDVPEAKVIDLRNVSRDVLSLSTSVNDDGSGELGNVIQDEESVGDPLEAALRADRINDLRQLLDTLSEADRELIERRFGLGREAETLDPIAAERGVSREYVRTRQQAIIKQMRQLAAKRASRFEAD